MASLLAILQLLSQIIPAIGALITQAIEAHTTGDQARLDAIHAQAVALADTLKPAGV